MIGTLLACSLLAQGLTRQRRGRALGWEEDLVTPAPGARQGSAEVPQVGLRPRGGGGGVSESQEGFGGLAAPDGLNGLSSGGCWEGKGHGSWEVLSSQLTPPRGLRRNQQDWHRLPSAAGPRGPPIDCRPVSPPHPPSWRRRWQGESLLSRF